MNLPDTLLSLNVRYLGGEVAWSGDVVSSESVDALQSRIAMAVDQPPIAVQLLMGERLLPVDATLAAAGVTGEVTLTLALRSSVSEAMLALQQFFKRMEQHSNVIGSRGTLLTDGLDLDDEEPIQTVDLPATLQSVAKSLQLDAVPDELEAWLLVLLSSGKRFGQYDDNFQCSTGQLATTISTCWARGGLAPGGLLYLSTFGNNDNVLLFMVDIGGELAEIFEEESAGGVWYANVWDDIWSSTDGPLLSADFWRAARNGSTNVTVDVPPRRVAPSVAAFFDDWGTFGKVPIDRFIPEERRRDWDAFLEALRQSESDIPNEFHKGACRALRFASDELRSDREVVLESVRVNGLALEYASPLVQGDREVVLQAVRRHGNALRFASEELRADYDIVLEAANDRIGSFQWAALNLRDDDHNIVSLLVGNGQVHALAYATERVRSDRLLILTAVQQSFEALQHASAVLQGDREIVTASYMGDEGGVSLAHASPELRADRDFMLDAIRQDSQAFEFASEQLRADRELFLEALRDDDCAFRYASPELRADRELVLQALQHGGDALEYASAALRADREVVLEAVKADPDALSFASEQLQADSVAILHEAGAAPDAWEGPPKGKGKGKWK